MSWCEIPRASDGWMHRVLGKRGAREDSITDAGRRRRRRHRHRTRTDAPQAVCRCRRSPGIPSGRCRMSRHPDRGHCICFRLSWLNFSDLPCWVPRYTSLYWLRFKMNVRKLLRLYSRSSPASNCGLLAEEVDEGELQRELGHGRAARRRVRVEECGERTRVEF